MHLSKCNDHLYKKTLGFSFILIFLNSHNNNVQCPEDVNYFYQQLLLFGKFFHSILIAYKLAKFKMIKKEKMHSRAKQKGGAAGKGNFFLF